VLKMSRVIGQYRKKYAVFLSVSEDPVDDGYLVQIRLVSRFGLKFYFRAITEKEYDTFPDQLGTMPELCWEFVQQQNQMWGTDMGSDRLEGVFGGDDYWEMEKLSYGIMVENSYHDIYRIWSRCWLVTK